MLLHTARVQEESLGRTMFMRHIEQQLVLLSPQWVNLWLLGVVLVQLQHN